MDVVVRKVRFVCERDQIVRVSLNTLNTIVPNPLNFKIADGFRNAERPSECSGGTCRCCGGMVGVDVGGGVECLRGSRLEVR